MSTDKRKIDNFLQCAIDNGAHSNTRNLRQHLKYMFSDIPLKNKRVLDVGGGSGLLTLWAAVQGADALCLEPGAEGSTSGVLEKHESIKSCIGSEVSASISAITLQSFLGKSDSSYDVIIMGNSINHVDEEGCIRLAYDDAARSQYLELLSQLYEALTPGGYFVVTDCSRSNFFNDLGLKSPLMPSIEWDKHQSPYFWDKLFQVVGFKPASIQWSSPNTFGTLGRILFGNRLLNYFTLSHFRMVCRKPE